MKKLHFLLMSAVILGSISSQVLADVCDYRPSQLIGRTGTTVVGSTGAAVAAGGTAMQAAGFYTLTNAVTGATMLGSTLAGPSAAGTVGIIGGSAGLLGSAAAVAMAPAVIVAAAATAVGVGVYEGVCFFEDKRITNFHQVREIMNGIALSANSDYFQVDENRIFIRISNTQGMIYWIKNLYIVNGVLMHRDWFKNTTIGNIAYVAQQ